MGDEQSETDADWRDECGAMLLGSQQEDCEDQHRRQKHLNEQAAGERCILCQTGLDGEFLQQSASGMRVPSTASPELTFGNKADTTPALAMAPSICATNTTAARM